LAQDSEVDTMTGDGGNKYFRQGRDERTRFKVTRCRSDKLVPDARVLTQGIGVRRKKVAS